MPIKRAWLGALPARCMAALLQALSATALLTGLACAQSPAPIVIGVSTPLSGPNSAYGRGLLQGLEIAFEPLRKAGLDGRPFELRVLDDAGRPATTADHVRRLIAEGAVALTGLQGNRSVEAVRALLQQSGVPLVGAASSASALRDPPQRTIFNLRAGAGDEVAAVVAHLDTVGIDRVAVIALDDALGNAGVAELSTELVRVAMRPVAIESMAVGADERVLNAALARICAGPARAVLLALDARLALAALRGAGTAGCAQSMRFVAMSETGAAIDMSGTGAEARGLMVSQVVPHPSQVTHPLVAIYRRALGDRPLGSYATVEGFLYGRVITEALKACTRRVSPACVVEALETRLSDVSGWRFHFARDDRIGSRFVDLTYLGPDGRIRR